MSPFLFILAIDPLYQLIHKATDLGLLSKLEGRVAHARISIYADNAVSFIKPTAADIANATQLLSLFGKATELRTNLQKTSVAPISCECVNLEEILSRLPITTTGLLIRYLRLPLAIRRLKKIDF